MHKLAIEVVTTITESHPKRRLFRVAQPGPDTAEAILELLEKYDDGTGKLVINDRRFSIAVFGGREKWVTLVEYDPEEGPSCGFTFVDTSRYCSICERKHDGIVHKKSLDAYIRWWLDGIKQMGGTQAKEA